MSAIDQSLAGLRKASQRFESAARRIVAGGAAQTEAAGGSAGSQPAQASQMAQGGPPSLLSDDLVGAMVDLLSAEHSFKANATAAGRIADMQKAYLDRLGDRSGSGAA